MLTTPKARRVEQHEIGMRALADDASIREAEHRRRLTRELVHRLLERQRVGNEIFEHPGGVVGPAERLKVRAGVAGTGHQQRVLRHALAELDVRRTLLAVDAEHRREVFGQRQIEHRVEHVDPAAVGQGGGGHPVEVPVLFERSRARR